MKKTRELTRWVPLLCLAQVYPTVAVATSLHRSSYLWATGFFVLGLLNLKLINRGLGPKEINHD